MQPLERGAQRQANGPSRWLLGMNSATRLLPHRSTMYALEAFVLSRDKEAYSSCRSQLSFINVSRVLTVYEIRFVLHQPASPAHRTSPPRNTLTLPDRLLTSRGPVRDSDSCKHLTLACWPSLACINGRWLWRNTWSGLQPVTHRDSRPRLVKD